jgi:hypothetical protein
MKVLFDKDYRLPEWTTRPTEGTTQDGEVDGVQFTIDAWKEGRDMWPRLLYSGTGIDLSAYTKLIFEFENPSDTAQSIVVAAKSVPEDNAGLATQLPPKSTSQVNLDISDGAPLDQSNVREMFAYQYMPLTKSSYTLKKITAIVNPDFVSKRTALGLQIAETQRSFDLLKKSAPKDANSANSLQVTGTQLESLTKEFEQRQPGYAISVQKALLAAENSIARTGMDSRAADLWAWSSPLGMPIREGTLPSPTDGAVKELNDTVCLNQYKALCLNISAGSKPQSVRLKLIAPTGKAVGNANPFSLRPTFFAKARDSSMVADAIGVSSTEVALEVPAYQTHQVIVWIDTKKPGMRAGRYNATIEMTSGAGQKTIQKIPVNITVADVRLASKLPLSLSNWAYFYMGSTKVTDGLEKETVANLRDYGMNTWNMDYTQVPLPVVNADGKYGGLEQATLKRLTQLMELLQGQPDEMFVVWLGFQRTEIREALSKPGILSAYLKDLHELLDHYKVSLDKRYIMLWDEPKLPELRESVEWMKKIRALDPSFKFYDDGTAIPSDENELKEFISLTDRWFPNWDQLYVQRPEVAKKVDAMNIPGMGFYRCLMSRNNRGTNIYEYYRLMGWYTMEHGFETLAFWVHNVGAEDAWDGTTGSSSGGIVVYQKDGKLLSSRRWELFREGLDDYKTAQAALGTTGIIDARKNKQLQQICEAVSAHPNDVSYADQMRFKLIDLAVKKKAKAHQ